MTKKRREQFEADRQKMLSSIGLEPEESFVPEVEEAEESQDLKDFHETLEDLKARNPSPEAYEERATAAFEDECEFERSLRGKSKEEEKLARKLKHNRHVRAKQRLKERGEVNAFGTIVNFMDWFQSSAGGGPLFWIFAVLVMVPVGIYWLIKSNFVLASMVFFGFLGVSRFLMVWVSYPVQGFVEMAISGGPRFICDIREGSPAKKLIVKIANKIMWVAAHSYLFVFAAIATWVAVDANWTYTKWTTYYSTGLVMASVGSLFAWFFGNVIGYAIYVGIINRIIDKKTKYRLRYFYDPDRVMISTRNGPLADRNERHKALKRDVAGIA